MARIVLALLCVYAAGLANPWSIDVGPPPPWAWQRVAAASDGSGGAWLATSAGAPANVYFTRVTGDSVVFGPYSLPVGYEQQPLLATPDGQGGALFLIEEFTSWPPQNNQLRLVLIGADGSTRWSTLACSTQVGASCLRPQLSVGPTAALVGWANSAASGTEVRFQTISLDGTRDGGPFGEPLCSAFSLGAAAAEDSFVVSAADSTFIVKGGARYFPWLSGVPLLDPCIVHVAADAVDVVGYTNGAVLLDHRGRGGVDTLATGLVQPAEVRVAELGGSCFISYRRDQNIYGRWFNPLTATVGEELSVCAAAGSQFGHQLSLGSSAVGAAWVDRRFGSDDSRVYCQYVSPSGIRWEDGVELGELPDFGGSVPLTMCGGDSAGLVAWVLPNGSLRVTVIDSPSTDAAPEPPASLPENLSLATYPNPFNASTTISFDLPVPGEVDLEVYNVTGQRIQRLLSGPLPAGSHRVAWTPTVSSGTYYVLLKSARAQTAQAVQLVR